jgi:hypothetical protein
MNAIAVLVAALEPFSLGAGARLPSTAATTEPAHYETTVRTALAVQAAPAPTPKVEIVSVTGCLRENPPNTWTLVSATDPVPSSANAPQPKDIPATPPAGKNEYRLIGVFEFNMPSHKDHTVVIKGLFIKATPTSRINVTSVTTATASCAAGTAK